MEDWSNTITVLAREKGCHSCGAACGEQHKGFYQVQFYILPTRLVRKRHKDRKQSLISCRTCYEQDDELPLWIDGERRTVRKTPQQDPESKTCELCGKGVNENHPGLYASLTSIFVVDDSLIEDSLLAFFCGECTEKHDVKILADASG